ncbi:MAG: hypothetical protein JNK14_14380 [Chitinophagaceae bacterium]|nr:hypothetical protein [Chitinophagaceae bacterium]
MKLPFTIQEFLEVFKDYNRAIWPLQVIFWLTATAMIIMIIKRSVPGRWALTVLSVLWLWMGIVYHYYFFSGINTAAYVFGTLFVLQGIFFLLYGFSKNVSFHFRKSTNGFAAVLVIIYALLIYPAIGYFTGHAYPYSPTFGLPCPTTIYTFGMLLLAEKRLSLYLLIIPFIWSVIGFSAALALGMYEDTGLIVAAIAAAMIGYRNRGNKEY